MDLRGTVIDDQTLRAVSGAVVSVVTATDGEQTGRGGGGPLDTGPDGSFELAIGSDDPGFQCGFPPFVRRDDPDFPAPDQILVIIERDGCELRIEIELNANTVVDMNFPDNVIELVDPILVPPCPEAGTVQAP